MNQIVIFDKGENYVSDLVRQLIVKSQFFYFKLEKVRSQALKGSTKSKILSDRMECLWTWCRGV